MATDPTLWLKENPVRGIFIGDKLVNRSYLGNTALIGAIRPTISDIADYIQTSNISYNGSGYEIVFNFSDSGYLSITRLLEYFGIVLIRAGSNVSLGRNKSFYKLIAYNPYIDRNYHTDSDILFTMEIKSTDEANSFSIVSTLYDKNNQQLGTYTSSMGSGSDPITGTTINDWYLPWFELTNNWSGYFLGGTGYPFNLDGINYRNKFLPIRLKLISTYSGTNPLRVWLHGAANHNYGTFLYPDYVINKRVD